MLRMNYDQYYVSFGFSEPNLFRINIPINEMKEAYKKGIEIIDFIPFETFMEWDHWNDEYRIKINDDKHVSILEKYGLSEVFERAEEGTACKLIMRDYSFIELYFRICKLGNNFFNYTDLSNSNVIKFHD